MGSGLICVIILSIIELMEYSHMCVCYIMYGLLTVQKYGVSSVNIDCMTHFPKCIIKAPVRVNKSLKLFVFCS